jgi:HSP90 family molecular chaperone
MSMQISNNHKQVTKEESDRLYKEFNKQFSYPLTMVHLSPKEYPLQ